MSEVNSIINQLNNVKDKISVFIPSKKNDAMFLPITLSQQKKVIDKIVVSSFGLIDFYNSMYNIFKTSSNINMDELNTIDRINILLYYRRNINNIYQEVDLTRLIEKNKSLELPPLTKTIATDKLTIGLAAPSLSIDYKFNNFIINTYKDENEIVGKLLVNEICKFIKTITINESNKVISFDDINIKDKFAIVESLELTVFKEVMVYINVIRDAEVNYVRIDDKQIDIGPELFML